MSRARFSGLFFWVCLLCCFSLLFGAGAAFAAEAAGYKIVRRMPVGGEGGWDYLRVDPDAHRIYIARQTHMMVVDEQTGKLITDLQGLKGIHGMALAFDLGKGFTSNGQANSVTIFDLKTLKPITEVPIPGQGPDSIIYDPMTKRVFTLNGKSKDANVLDATTGKVIGTIKLEGKPEEAALDGKGNLYVNNEDKSTLMQIDVNTFNVKASWPLAPCEGPSALAIDTKNHRLFSACDKVMVVVNSDTGKIVASIPIGSDPDGNGYDPATGLLFASCKEGLVSVIHQDSPDKYTPLGNVTTQYLTRTMAMDLKTHHVFTVTADFKKAAAPTAENPHPRPEQIANSFVILELAQQ
jgi:hypothetical protein